MIEENPAAAHPRILVVDDTESNRYVLATWLRRAGYEVTEARTGQEAIDAVDSQPFDLAVLDVYLPDLSGYAVCEYIKARKNVANLPVLHVSSVATQSADRSEGLRRGAEGYLAEPIEREELLATVEALLRAASAQRIAERLARRLRQLNEATLAVNEAVGVEELITQIASQAAKLFEAPAIAAVIADDVPIVVSAARDGSASLETCSAKDVDSLFRAVAYSFCVTGTSVASILPNAKGEAYLCARLAENAEQRAVLMVDGTGAMDGADESVAVLSQFARAASTALRNMRSYDIERGIALTLQKSLLPDAPPVFPGVEIETRYAASAKHSEVGGDFYEIFSLDERRVAIAVGDVVGHSLEAATIMAQLRTGIRCYALEGHGPTAIIDRLNRLLYEFHRDVTATMCFALYDTVSGECQIANAGHLPPLLATRDGVEYLPLGGAMLGLDARARPPHVVSLAPGDVLLFYTDGLIERRDEGIDDGLERLARAVERRPERLDELCDELLRENSPRFIDDVAIVALRRTGIAATAQAGSHLGADAGIGAHF